MKFVPGSWLSTQDEVTALAQHLFATYLSALARREKRDWQPTPLAVSALTPSSYWRDLAKSLLAKGSLDEQLRINDAQRVAAMHDPSHPFSLAWRPESEEHFRAIVSRMAEALPWTPRSLLEDALVRACGFATKEALAGAYRPRNQIRGMESTDGLERATRTRLAAWESTLELRASQARHFDRWLNLTQIGIDGATLGEPLASASELSVSVRSRGKAPQDANAGETPAFSEHVPASVKEAFTDFRLSPVARLRLENLPWLAWRERFSRLNAILVDTTGRDEDVVEEALRAATSQSATPLAELVADFETLDVWQSVTTTVGREFVLELEDRCEQLTATHALPEGVAGITDDPLSRVARARRWVMALVRPLRQADWLSPMAALQLLGFGTRLTEALATEAAKHAYQSFCCGGRAVQLQARLQALHSTLSTDDWSERVPQDWTRMLASLDPALRERLTQHKGRMFFDARATRNEWAQCFRALPPQWLNGFEAGPSVGELLDALPDEAVLEATIEPNHGFASFDAVAFPREALPAVTSCASENLPQVLPARANLRATPPIPRGWLQVEW